MADRVLERVTEAVLHESLLLHIADGPYPEYVRNLSAVKKAIVFVRLRAAGCRGYGAGLQDAGGRLGGGARSRAVRPRASPQRASTDRHSRAVRADALNVRSIERGVDVPTDQPRQLVLRDRREAMPSSSRKAPRSGSRKMSASLSCASPSSLRGGRSPTRERLIAARTAVFDRTYLPRPTRFLPPRRSAPTSRQSCPPTKRSGSCRTSPTSIRPRRRSTGFCRTRPGVGASAFVRGVAVRIVVDVHERSSGIARSPVSSGPRSRSRRTTPSARTRSSSASASSTFTRALRETFGRSG